MRGLILTATAFLFMTSVGLADIVTDKSSIDFGDITTQETKYGSVLFTNNGTENATISDYYVSGDSCFSM